MTYTPPFTVSSESIKLVAEIAEEVTKYSIISRKVNPNLRRINRIRSIHSSLAIEGNTLTLDQVTDIIDGIRVLGNPREIMVVKNALSAYDMIDDLDPFDLFLISNINNLLKQ